jgi:FkbM family methyltransferase
MAQEVDAVEKLEALFWESYRERVEQDRTAETHPVLSRLPILSFLYRTLVRVRRLGVVWTAQERLFRLMVDEITFMRHVQLQLQMRWAGEQCADVLPAWAVLPNGLLGRSGNYFNTDSGIVWEVENIYFDNIIKPETASLVLDIGAHIGAYSFQMKRKNPGVRIIAVEPMRENWLLCQANIGFWTDVKVLHNWIGYQPISQPVMLVDERYSGSHIILARDQIAAQLERLPGIYRIEDSLPPPLTLESVLDGIEGQISILKLDCEGAEQDILLHAPLATLQRCQWIVGEYHFGKQRFMAEIWPRLEPVFTLAELSENTPLLSIFLLKNSLKLLKKQGDRTS